MAFIDLETERADYRLIFGKHGTPVPAQYLPENCTAILLEGLYSDPSKIRLGRGAKGPRGSLERQYQFMIEPSRVREIPLVLAEPTCYGDKIDELLSSFDLRFTLFQWMGLPPGFYLGSFNGGVKRTNLAFRFVDRIVDQGIQKSSAGYFIDRFRPLVMAEKATSFADLQTREGISRPNIAILMGGAHTFGVRALEMSPGERVEEILQYPSLSYYFNADLFHLGYFMRYSSLDETWDTGIYEDPRLKIT